MARKRIEDLPLIARNLRRLREAKDLTQDEVAEIMGIKQAQYSKWETGRDRPRAVALAGLALALRVKADDILAGLATLDNGKVRMVTDRASGPRAVAKTRARRAI